ncbi:glycosyltransferase [Fimbriiglobus ruber]|uniref:Glycosyl transferase-related protein n=1 Tax=Fimbriiglobus ruber TaxID=1908690 RepID=A0A225EEM3_9BACT|nr:glycosyltransferase [Fimbriiglobus ruber]OWK46737.1 glycosyl transferase-related protein [Fimbriiglobus ruber]
MISFVIPAHNEERHLGTTLAALFASAQAVGEPFEVIVVNDTSTDHTRAIAEAGGARVVDVTHRHIALTRNTGARASVGEVLFFVDADTQANPAAIRAGLRAIRAGAIGGGCAFRYDGPVPLWAKIVHPIGIEAARLLKLVGGCFLFCRREAFTAVGGFSERYRVGEDVAFVNDLKRRGRFVVPREMVTTSNRKLDRMKPRAAISLLLRFAARGPDMHFTQEELDLWYGPAARD